MRVGHNQESFSRLWGGGEGVDGYLSDEEARRARDARYRELIKEGQSPQRSSLPGQLKKYDGFGKPNGGICTVYYIRWETKEDIWILLDGLEGCVESDACGEYNGFDRREAENLIADYTAVPEELADRVDRFIKEHDPFYHDTASQLIQELMRGR